MHKVLFRHCATANRSQHHGETAFYLAEDTGHEEVKKQVQTFEDSLCQCRGEESSPKSGLSSPSANPTHLSDFIHCHNRLENTDLVIDLFTHLRHSQWSFLPTK